MPLLLWLAISLMLMLTLMCLAAVDLLELTHQRIEFAVHPMMSLIQLTCHQFEVNLGQCQVNIGRYQVNLGNLGQSEVSCRPA